MIAFEKTDGIFRGKYTCIFNVAVGKYMLACMDYDDSFLNPMWLESEGRYDTEDKAIHRLFKLAKVYKWVRKDD